MTPCLGRILALAALLLTGEAARAALDGFDDAEPADLGELLEPIRAEFNLPALAGAITTTDRLVAVGAVGTRALGREAPVTRDDRFHLGSCTKAMTATLIGMLVEEGKLTWETTLGELLADGMPDAAPGWAEVTIDCLLAHRSGCTGTWPEQFNRADRRGPVRRRREAFLQAALAEPLVSTPGAKYDYSNKGYILLGCVVERLFDQPWEQVMRERLFSPLGITSGGFGAPGGRDKVDQPWPHLTVDGEVKPLPPGPGSDNPDTLGPAGTAHMALADWARFVALHLRGGAGRDDLLRAETIERLHTPQFGGEYAGGWIRTERVWGGTVLTHNGSNTLNYCVVWMAPERGFAVMAATNIAGKGAETGTDRASSRMIQRLLGERD